MASSECSQLRMAAFFLLFLACDLNWWGVFAMGPLGISISVSVSVSALIHRLR